MYEIAVHDLDVFAMKLQNRNIYKRDNYTRNIS